MRERWRPVVGHPGYEVSDLGRVRSLDRTLSVVQFDRHSGRRTRVARRRRGQLLKPGATSTGHLTVCLRKGRSVLVHHLVLEAFVGPRPPKPFEGLHWDDTPANNRLPNLRWGTRSENIHDAIRNGRAPVGERRWNAKLKDADIPVIRSLFGRQSYAQLGRDYGVSESAIRRIKDGKSWVHIAAVGDVAIY